MSAKPPFRLSPVRSPDDARAVWLLFREYAASLDVDLSYQDFEAELAGLPGKYAPPMGELLLAIGADGSAQGCVALRPIDEPRQCCEMKRLYVSPSARGLGLGGLLVDAVVAAAERIGYREMRLDSLPSMTDAIALYRRRGFEEIAPYYDTPVAGTVFLRKWLGS